MNILINASNLNGGGGVQVADSICVNLKKFTMHHFVVVLSKSLSSTARRIEKYENVTLIEYTYPSRDWGSLLTGRNKFLDILVVNYNISCVLTIFGPIKWKPKCPHLCGFALSHIVMPESPYFLKMPLFKRLRSFIQIKCWELIFRRSGNYFYTENPLITERLTQKFNSAKIYTITNYYNQVFDHIDQQIYHELPYFNGWQFLNVGSSSPHKNLTIAIDIAKILKSKFREEISKTTKPNFRFLFTIEETEFPVIPKELREHFYFIGKVDISEVPSLYKQCDILFQPTLLECFTAVYPEAMRMKLPIITTNLEFARGLCGRAALYYDAMDPLDAASKFVDLITNDKLQKELIREGEYELNKFDNYNKRLEKIINICERISL